MKNLILFTSMLFLTHCENKEDAATKLHVQQCIALLQSQNSELTLFEKDQKLTIGQKSTDYFLVDKEDYTEPNSFYHIKVHTPASEEGGTVTLSLRNCNENSESWFPLNKKDSERIYSLMRERM